jgi:pimeloyl-ACP methyl ester carboxylesterase
MLIEVSIILAFAQLTIRDNPRIAEPPAVTTDTLDRSPHSERFVRANGVRLHLLDWGGSGPLLMFLPGYGDNAHIFDDLAPAFTDHFHVVALTPRGFPPSSASDSVYTIAQLAEDVRAVMDSLRVPSAVLAGHSISGAVITQFGIVHPKRLAAAIYLDASLDFKAAYQRSHRPGKPTPADTTSVAYRAWQERYSDSHLSPSALAAFTANDRAWQIDSVEATRRKALVAALATEVRARPHEPWGITAPALALCAGGSFDRGLGWLTPDSPGWNEAHTYYNVVSKEKRDECEKFAARNRGATVFMLDSGHYVFVDDRAEVVKLMLSFLARIPLKRRVPVTDTPVARDRHVPRHMSIGPLPPSWTGKRVSRAG